MQFMFLMKTPSKWSELLSYPSVTFVKKQFSHNIHILILNKLHIQVFYLLHEEGFFVGASSGLNVAAAVKVGSQLVYMYVYMRH